MIGESAVVSKMINGEHSPGWIRARGEEWQAISLDPDATIAVGADVIVHDVRRGLLIVYEVASPVNP